MNHPTDPLLFVRDVLTGSFMFDFTRYIGAALLIGLVVWVMARTRLAGRKLQQRQATGADMRREFLQSVRSCVVYALISLVVVSLMKAGVLHPIGRSAGWASTIALLVLMIVLHDAWFYWTHRALHHPALYRRFHLAHHRSVTPTPFAIYSFSVGEAAINAMFVFLWQIFVTTPGVVFISFMLFQVLRNGMGHAGYELHPRWWLSTPLTRWINTTTHHDLHHSGGFNHNYGLYFTWWDKAMRTEHPRYAETFAKVTAPAPAASVGLAANA